jgi:hypothetical protein
VIPKSHGCDIQQFVCQEHQNQKCPDPKRQDQHQKRAKINIKNAKLQSTQIRA